MIKFLIFGALGGICKAVMDSLQFHYDKNIFQLMPCQNWWNPKESWKNKYKNHDYKQGERFLFAKTLLVFIADAWHFFEYMHYPFTALNVLCYYKWHRSILFSIFVPLIYEGLIFLLFFHVIFQLKYYKKECCQRG